MKRLLSLISFLVLSVALMNCGGGKITNVQPQPNIAGEWEFMAISSTNTSSITGIEVALKEGQVLVNAVNQPNGSISASGPAQIAFVNINPTTTNISSFGGGCPPTGSPTNSLSGTLAGLGGPISGFTFTENGNLFNVTATLAGDGATINGTYQSAAGSACVDSGTIMGTVVSKLSGTYNGQMMLPDGTTDTATATLSQSGSTLTVNLVVTGADNTSFTLSGPVTGKAFSVTGTFQGQTVSYSGFYELTFDSVTQVNDIQSLYLVNTTNAALPVYAGTLIIPQT
jgi:hypothetical protein